MKYWKMSAGYLIIVVTVLAVFGFFIVTGTESEEPAVNGGSEEMKAKYQMISQETAKEWMDTHDNAVVLDVREQEEFDQGHIKNAVLLPLGQIDNHALDTLSDLEQEILVYCRNGRRSAEAAEKLAELGYTQVYDFGGIITWPYETEKR